MPNRTAYRTLPIHLFEDMLEMLDEVQKAVMVGQMDDHAPEALNWLKDLHLTLEETMQELEERLAY